MGHIAQFQLRLTWDQARTTLSKIRSNGCLVLIWYQASPPFTPIVPKAKEIDSFNCELQLHITIAEGGLPSEIQASISPRRTFKSRTPLLAG